jgi:hypothetical protein
VLPEVGTVVFPSAPKGEATPTIDSQSQTTDLLSLRADEPVAGVEKAGAVVHIRLRE